MGELESLLVVPCLSRFGRKKKGLVTKQALCDCGEEELPFNRKRRPYTTGAKKQNWGSYVNTELILLNSLTTKETKWLFRPSKHWLCFSFGFVIERQVRVYATVPTNPPNGCHKTQPRAKCVILCKHMYFWDSARSEKSCRTPSQVAILAVSCFFFMGKRADNRNRLNSSALAGTAGSEPQGWDKAATQRRPFQKHSCMFFLAYMSPFVSAFYSLLQLWKITTLSTCSPSLVLRIHWSLSFQTKLQCPRVCVLSEKLISEFVTSEG